MSVGGWSVLPLNATAGIRLNSGGKKQYQFDGETGLFILGAGSTDGGGRYYDPVTGKFISDDPIGYAADRGPSTGRLSRCRMLRRAQEAQVRRRQGIGVAEMIREFQRFWKGLLIRAGPVAPPKSDPGHPPGEKGTRATRQ